MESGKHCDKLNLINESYVTNYHIKKRLLISHLSYAVSWMAAEEILTYSNLHMILGSGARILTVAVNNTKKLKYLTENTKWKTKAGSCKTKL